MNIEQEIFKKSTVNTSNLIHYGFTKKNKEYFYTQQFHNEQFKAEILINALGEVTGKVIDVETNEEYVNIKTSMTGNFVSAMREEYKEILYDIKEKCFKETLFVTEQANRIAEKVVAKYKAKPEFLWKKFPTYGVFRNESSNKWFAIIMLIDKYKLTKKEHEEVEVLNVKLNEEQVKKLVKQEGYYKAYHMKSNDWVTISLNNIVNDKEIMDLIDRSYENTNKK